MVKKNLLFLKYGLIFPLKGKKREKVSLNQIVYFYFQKLSQPKDIFFWGFFLVN